MIGSGNIQNEVTESEHAYVNGVGVKKVTVVDGLGNLVNSTPTTQTNGSLVLGYTGSNLTTITKTIGGISYQKTLTYSGSVLTDVSVWVQL